jgi:hypothetical protein
VNPPIFLHCFPIKLGCLTVALLHLDSPKKKVSNYFPSFVLHHQNPDARQMLEIKAKKERKKDGRKLIGCNRLALNSNGYKFMHQIYIERDTGRRFIHSFTL